jgi:uncharacterized protein (TIGR02246 family)
MRFAGVRFGLLLLALTLPALVVAEEPDETAIRAVLDKQVADWNRGDIPAFVQSYAEQCTFIGKTVVEGRAGVEERYRRTYATPAAMGHLAFTDLKIKNIDGRVAVVTGAYHLERASDGGGDKSGLFSLVFERQAGVWRIVLDHTS